MQDESSHPVDDRMRVLDLAIETPAGGLLGLQVPWDRSAFDLEPILTADLDGDHDVVAHPLGRPDDVLESPLGKVLRSAENPQGSEAVIVRVLHDGSAQEFIVRCNGAHEPQPHRAYPRGLDGDSSERVQSALGDDDTDWFCDGSSTLSCCVAHRDAPQQLAWVSL